MSNSLTTTRTRLRDLLAGAGLTSVDYLPERPQPPMVIVVPGQPYLQRGERFGQHKIGLTILMLTRTATNERASEELDELITTATIAVFNADGFSLDRVEAPHQFQVNNATYLGCTADVTTADQLEVS